MGNNKWNTQIDKGNDEMYVFLMISRNKDNKEVPNFKERNRSFVSKAYSNKVFLEWKHFVKDALPGEMCRLYKSVNARDMKRVQKDLAIALITSDNFKFNYIESVVAGIAARKQNAAEHKWMFDFDLDSERAVHQFVNDIYAIDKDIEIEIEKTPNGYAVIVNHGFDTRTLLDSWECATLKRDDLLCVDYIRKI